MSEPIIYPRSSREMLCFPEDMIKLRDAGQAEFVAELINLAIAQAVAAERERCEWLARDLYHHYHGLSQLYRSQELLDDALKFEGVAVMIDRMISKICKGDS